MVDADKFYDCLKSENVSFFVGVPDSLLKELCACIGESSDNIVAANEGNAIALATGYHLATGKIGLVYLQNSGLGNVINPLASLVDVYNIPMLLVIGWRGEKKDEPQHVKQGGITLKLLDLLQIPYYVVGKNYDTQIRNALGYARKMSTPFALVVKEGAFKPYRSSDTKSQDSYRQTDMSREVALKCVVDLLQDEDIIVSCTGKLSRELCEYRGEGKDFLTVGSMGHCSQIALGIALKKPERNVYCFDGDGSVIMHMGALAIIGSMNPKNFVHIIFNNGAHDSVGGQPTAGFDIDFCSIARACGYKQAFRVSSIGGIKQKFDRLGGGACLLEVRVGKGARKDLGRPKMSPVQRKRVFERFVRK